MSQRPGRIHPFLVDRIFLSTLACAYVVYLMAFGHVLYLWMFAPSNPITEHQIDMTSNIAIQYWTVANMRNAIDDNQQNGDVSSLTRERGTVTGQGKASLQQGQPPSDESLSYPLSTVGKVFFTNAAGQNMSCSGTAVTSPNSSVVDTAGHCFYQHGDWMQNVLFCPQYDNGNTPYGCWAARDLEIPSDWLNAQHTI
ncbi:trypsin-like serine peptidase [Dictyobacter kobayashii]|uniref:Peptidase S1 domain-containing protein n=1 Tax=Dictyobacter kobayashii TaxID=2014872 RepID=A0A402ASE5_9CHLR|nr:hypothetical protein [Dictyobacter kobayashii]GCE22017.1 hypothetical protein KDK_58170 [Dictyobacter kobayashii]